MMAIEYVPIPEWPPLAWLACCHRGGPVAVWHGKRVETRPDWFCEATWPGSFEDGNFDRNDLTVGTGGRTRDDGMHFVAPGNTIDRIVSLEIDSRLWVSNSIACLAGGTGAELDPSYPAYYDDFLSVIDGLGAYKRTIRTSRGDMRITYCGSVGSTQDGTSYQSATVVRRSLDSYDTYRDFLLNNLALLARNMADAGRRYPYQFLATISSGYDSPAVATLAREAGCAAALCIDKDNDGNSEGGAQIATRLGLEPVHIPREGWRKIDGVAALFIAAHGTAEGAPLASASESLEGRVLLTGYHGDKVWATDTKDLSESVVRGDPSGLSLAEFRLWKGFIHCPIPFWGVRQIGDINAISHLPEMRPWDVGGSYTRPIPRRIVETAGVPREWFGQTKKAASVQLSEGVFDPASWESYRLWLRQHRDEWWLRRRVPPPLSVRYDMFGKHAYDTKELILKRTPYFWRFTTAPKNGIGRPTRLMRHAFPWAIDELGQRYRYHFGLYKNVSRSLQCEAI
ncbi:MAG: hypothetical protein ACRD4G_05290 [Bryobacteraceae bacterium]